MTRLAVLFSSAVFLTAIPYGSAGPACAKKYYQQKSCVQQCAGKWGYPGLMMGMGSFGDVAQKTPESDWDSIIASACGIDVSSTASASTATPSVAGAIGGAPPAYSSEPSVATAVASSSAATFSAPSASPTTISSSSAFIAPSSSSVASVASSSSTFVPPPPTTFSTEEQPSSTSTSQFTPPATSIEQPAPTTSSTPPPAATTAASTSDSTDSSASTSSNSDSGNGSDASDSDVQSYLSNHNTLRAAHGASPLTWSNDAAVAAQKWANNCVFQHSGGTLGPFGENLAAGTGSSYGIPQALGSWAAEASQYDASNPVASHFTQMVWKATTEVGCAVAQCSGIFAASFGLASFYVCEYTVQGNVIGAFAQNVQA